MRMRSNISLVVLAMMASACGGDSGGEWAGTVTDSAGVQIVMNPESGIWDEAERPLIEEELKIGRTGGDTNYEFGQIAGIGVATSGTIYVLDQQARNIRAFDAEGNYLQTFSGPGEGPGELSQTAMGLVIAAGDTLLVPDMGLQRVNRFGPDGTPLGSFPTPISQGIPVRWETQADGRIVQQSRIMNFPGQTTTVEPKDLLLLRDGQGTLIDTVMTLPMGETLQMGENSMTIRLFEKEPIWALTNDGTVYFAMNSDYSIGAYDADGSLERVVRRPFDKKPVTEADKSAFQRAFREMFERQGLPPQAVEMILGGLQFAETYPAFATMMGGPGNSLWVQRVRTAADMSVGEDAEFDPQDVGSPEWDVFGADGRYLGVVRLPDRFTPLRVTGDRIYGIWRDDLDVQHVSRLRVEGGATQLMGDRTSQN